MMHGSTNIKFPKNTLRVYITSTFYTMLSDPFLLNGATTVTVCWFAGRSCTIHNKWYI